MKSYILAALLLSEAEAIRMTQRGIDKGDLMQSQPSHWRKNWPQGDIDDGTNDEDVMYIPALEKRREEDTDQRKLIHILSMRMLSILGKVSRHLKDLPERNSVMKVLSKHVSTGSSTMTILR